MEKQTDKNTVSRSEKRGCQRIEMVLSIWESIKSYPEKLQGALFDAIIEFFRHEITREDLEERINEIKRQADKIEAAAL